MDLNRLRVFVQVADSGGFTAAASKLDQRRSSVSRAVAGLERELNVQLFHRTTRRVSLTTAGETFYRRVAGHLAGLRDAIDELPERADQASGHLRITTPNDLGASLVPSLIASFRTRHPRVTVEVCVTNRVLDLVEEGFDASLRPGAHQLPDSSMRAVRLAPMRIGLYASPRYLSRHGTPQQPEQITHHHWIGGPGQQSLPFLPKSSVGSDDLMCVRGMLIEGLGLGLLPSFLATEYVATGALAAVTVPGFSVDGSLFLLRPPSSRVPRKTRAFIDHLREHLRLYPLSR